MMNKSLISSPHDDDKYLLEPGTVIPLTASTDATWTINDKIIGTGSKLSWSPTTIGTYTISAKTIDNKSETVTVYINKE